MNTVPGRSSASETRLVYLGVCVRICIVGGMLWGIRSRHAVFDITAGLICLGIVVLAVRLKHGSRPRRWADTCREAVWLVIGGSCLANLLLSSFGSAPWFTA